MTHGEFAELALINTGCKNPVDHLLRAAGVERYHNEPGVPSQTVGLHTWRLLAILLSIWPDASRNLIIATIFHDSGEGLTGDVPAPVKWGDLDLKSKLDAMDHRYTHDICKVPEVELTPAEVAMMKCSDYLELADHCSNSYTPAANRILKVGLRAVTKYAEKLPAADSRKLALYMQAQLPKWYDSFMNRPEVRFFDRDIRDSISTLGGRYD